MSGGTEPLKESLKNAKYGCFVITDAREDEMFSDEEEAEDMFQSVDYKDLTKMMSGNKMAEMKKPKTVNGILHNLEVRGKVNVTAPLHVEGQWWKVRILRTRTLGRLYVPADIYALSYELRQDPAMVRQGIIPMFLHKCGVSPSTITAFIDYVRHIGQRHNLMFSHLKQLFDNFEDYLPEDEKPVAHQLKQCFSSDEGRLVERAIEFPMLFKYLPQLLPFHFLSIVQDQEKYVLQKIEDAIITRPWVFGFKKLVNKNFNIIGTEASEKAYNATDFLGQIENPYRDSLIVYHDIKKKCKTEGHTRLVRQKLLENYEGRLDCQSALIFLAQNKITKDVRMDGVVGIMLYQLWYSEKQIAEGINTIFRTQMESPWILDIDVDNHPDFMNIREDIEQTRAARMINRLPVVVVSGKGGCGKTTVVTTVLSNAERYGDSKGAINDEEEGKDEAEAKEDDFKECSQRNIEDMDFLENKIYPDVLYVAPTGKAAKLLGQRAYSTGYTLHQIIWSYRFFLKRQREAEGGASASWNFADVNALVVDECSLVSVENFATLLNILLENSKLKKIVLLGDIRQLPSIDPGNFLADIFKCLNDLGCSVELQQNHRAESELIVANATKISKRRMPIFNPQRNFKLHKVPYDPQADFHNSVLEELLKKEEDLKSDKTSHIVAFRRNTCRWINEMCCRHYNKHNLCDDKNRPIFQVGDKVCMFKNGQVAMHEWKDNTIKEVLINKEDSEDPGNETVVEMHSASQCFMADQGHEAADDGEAGQGHVGQQGQGQNEAADGGESSNKKSKKMTVQQIRLCNGEIFFIKGDHEILEQGASTKSTRYLELCDEDPKTPTSVWVKYNEVRKKCNMKHAWAKTIHTFQGSECESVVYVVGNVNSFQTWQHVYTAVTRGRKSVHIVSSEDSLQTAVENKAKPRSTSLAFQLKGKLPRRQEMEDCLRGQTANNRQTDTTSCVPPELSAPCRHKANCVSNTSPAPHSPLHGDTTSCVSNRSPTPHSPPYGDITSDMSPGCQSPVSPSVLSSTWISGVERTRDLCADNKQSPIPHLHAVRNIMKDLEGTACPKLDAVDVSSPSSQWSEVDESAMADVVDQSVAEYYQSQCISERKTTTKNLVTRTPLPILNESESVLHFDLSSIMVESKRRNDKDLIDSRSKSDEALTDQSSSLFSSSSLQDTSVFARIKTKRNGSKSYSSSDESASSSTRGSPVKRSSSPSLLHGERTPPKQIKLANSNTQVTPLVKSMHLSDNISED